MNNVGDHVAEKVAIALIVANLVIAAEMKIILLGMETALPEQFKLLEKMNMIVFH